jgi:hypothetical protein
MSSYGSPDEHAAAAWGRMLAMDERLHDLRRQLDQKTSEIESLVAREQGISSIEKIDPSDYERLQQDVEELLEQWEETAQEESGHADDTPLNRLIGERFEIEQKIIAARGTEGVKGEDTDDEYVEGETATEDDWN